MMITQEKIKEWLDEIEQRPESAPLIIQHLANRLQDLAAWNESLRAENLELIRGNRVEEYERRIAHLEYQLDLLKRQIGGKLSEESDRAAEGAAPSEALSLLVYNSQGAVLRIGIDLDSGGDGALIGELHGELMRDGEPPRLLVVRASEELMFLFTSGRLAVHPAARLTPAPIDGGWDFANAPIPEALRSKERLACLTPIGRLSLAEFFVQVSRRGYVKKVLTSLASSILSQRYLGEGTALPADQVFETLLCGKESRMVLVSHEGYLLCLEAGRLPFSVEEAMRLAATDHLQAAMVSGAGKTILVMTQIGKAVALSDVDLETSAALRVKGRAVFSGQRRASGVRVIGAGAVDEADWAVALHSDGRLTLHQASALLGRGVLPVQGELLAFTTFTV